jgi:hypothetical protein
MIDCKNEMVSYRILYQLYILIAIKQLCGTSAMALMAFGLYVYQKKRRVNEIVELDRTLSTPIQNVAKTAIHNIVYAGHLRMTQKP